MANVNVRAEQYKESDAFGDTPMDVLRAHAYLDLINAVPAATRIALAEQQNDADGRRFIPARTRPTPTTAHARSATAAA